MSAVLTIAAIGLGVAAGVAAVYALGMFGLWCLRHGDRRVAREMELCAGEGCDTCCDGLNCRDGWRTV